MELKKIVEALLFVTQGPLKIETITQIIGDTSLDEVKQAVSELIKDYEIRQSAIQIVEIAGGLQLSTKRDYAQYIRKLYRDETILKLSASALETLAIVAYRQPITRADIEQIRGVMPELPKTKQARYVNDFGLSAYDASVLTASREMADYFDTCVTSVGNAKLCANWLIGELSAQLNRDGLDMAQCPVSPQQMSGMLVRIADNTISNAGAKEVFRTLWAEGGDADLIIDSKGLKQVSDSGAIEALVDEIITANADKVAEYRSGKDKLFGFFVGLAMKASKGKANPAQLNEVLLKKLAG